MPLWRGGLLIFMEYSRLLRFMRDGEKLNRYLSKLLLSSKTMTEGDMVINLTLV